MRACESVKQHSKTVVGPFEAFVFEGQRTIHEITQRVTKHGALFVQVSCDFVDLAFRLTKIGTLIEN